MDIAWAAGFIEGEGSFQLNGREEARWHPTVVACQVQREPLERLQRIFGGTIYDYAAKPRKHFKTTQPFSRWYLNGQRAVETMLTLYVLMSPRRQGQIEKCLTAWRAPRVYKAGYNKGKQNCKRGHPLSGANLYVHGKRGTRHCAACQRMRDGMSEEKALAPRSLAKASMTHCKHGHELSGDNLKFRRGARTCIACERAGRRRSYWKAHGGHPEEQQILH